jgi:hypothetical protein
VYRDASQARKKQEEEEEKPYLSLFIFLEEHGTLGSAEANGAVPLESQEKVEL